MKLILLGLTFLFMGCQTNIGPFKAGDCVEFPFGLIDATCWGVASELTSVIDENDAFILKNFQCDSKDIESKDKIIISLKDIDWFKTSNRCK